MPFLGGLETSLSPNVDCHLKSDQGGLQPHKISFVFDLLAEFSWTISLSSFVSHWTVQIDITVKKKNGYLPQNTTIAQKKEQMVHLKLFNCVIHKNYPIYLATCVA